MDGREDLVRRVELGREEIALDEGLNGVKRAGDEGDVCE